MISCIQFPALKPLLVTGLLALSGCSQEPATGGHEEVAERTWQPVHCATLASSSHNTQCGPSALDAHGQSFSIPPSLARRRPAVDPDDNHVFVSPAWAPEKLIQAAPARGLRDEVRFDAVGRCHERFALQATAQGIRNAFLNQSVEVAASRPPFANALSPSCQRLFLLLWFGRSPVLPRSLRRAAEAVLASDEAAWARPEGRKVHFVGHVKKLNHKFML